MTAFESDAMSAVAEADEGLAAVAPLRTRVAPILVLALTIAGAASMRGVLSPLQEAARIGLHLNDLQISLVQGLACAAPVAVLSLPLGRMIDRSNRVRILLALSVVWTLGAILSAFAQGFSTMFAARMLAGIGAFCALPPAISIAADLSPPHARGRALVLLSLGNVVGGALAFAAGGALFGWLSGPHAPVLLGLAPWRGTLLVFGLVSAVLTLCLLPLREPARHEVGAGLDMALPAALRALWARRGFLAPLFVGQLGVVMADVAAGIWAAPLLMRSYGLKPEQFAGWIGLTLLASGFVGAVAGGVLADTAGRRRLPGGVLFGAVVASALAIPGALFAVAPGTGGFALLLGLLLLCGTVAGAGVATALAVALPNELRGVCLSLFVVIAGLLGFGVAPSLVAAVSGLLGPGSLGTALAATGCVISIASFAGFVLAARRLRSD